jgi:hypothetical protein
VLRSLPHGLATLVRARIRTARGRWGSTGCAARAEQAGVRLGWRYARDIDPVFDSIRDEPGFKVIFADIERDSAAAG